MMVRRVVVVVVVLSPSLLPPIQRLGGRLQHLNGIGDLRHGAAAGAAGAAVSTVSAGRSGMECVRMVVVVMLQRWKYDGRGHETHSMTEVVRCCGRKFFSSSGKTELRSSRRVEVFDERSLNECTRSNSLSTGESMRRQKGEAKQRRSRRRSARGANYRSPQVS